MPRKSKCTKEVIEQAVKLRQVGVPDHKIAQAIHVAPNNMSKWINHPNSDIQREFSRRMKDAEVQGIAYLCQKVLEAARDGDWKAAAWLLERKYPGDFGKPEARLRKADSASSVPQIVLGVDVKAVKDDK